jgi:DNA repair exonuclease SbcCD ATPase subunit
MAISFHKIRYKNLLSTGNTFTDIQLDKSSTTLIIGENGAGKSTILDALSFALFNKPFRKVTKGQLMNSITKRELVVEVELSVGKNHYKVVRGVKPAVFEIYMNEVLLNQDSDNRDYQEFLEKNVLKINHKSFCQVVVLGSASFVPFMQLPTGQRREIIEDLLDLQIFTRMNSVLKQRVTENTNETWQSEKDRDLIDEKIKLVKEHISEVHKNSQKLAQEKKDRIKYTADQISQLIEQKFALDKEIEDLTSRILDQESVERRIKKLSNLQHQLEAKIASLKGDINFLNDHENCPTCRQHIAEDFRAESIQKKSEDITEVDGGLQKLADEYEAANARLKELMDAQSAINNKKFERHRVLTKVDGLEDYSNKLREELDAIKKTVEKPDTAKLDTLKVDREKVSLRLADLEEQTQLLGAASTLLKDGGIKSRIIKQYIPIINKLINKYLAALDFFVEFNLDENFNETIKSRFRDEFSYSSFSEGEKMRINLAILFTWRAVAKLRNSINTNILIMDEVFDSSLDSGGTEEFMKILSQLTNDTNVYIISHKTDQISDKFDNVIRFEKHRNFSRMVA